jgi:hypothetical protein
MIKKLFIGTFLMACFIFLSTALVFANEETKPWESMLRFRQEDKVSAQELGVSKEDFYAYRNEEREQHKEERMLQREERLEAAVERGCITAQEMEEKLQTKRGRFSDK